MDERVKRIRKVGIYGSQLLMSAIGANLQENPEFEVQKIEGSIPDITSKPSTISPDVILFDLTATQPGFVIPLMHAHPATLLIGVDLANNKMLLLCGKESRLLTMEDLLQVIQAGA
ncbi:MAG: hypothetical protein AB9866_24250 [Syntrophobacteraceae bacterium]